VKNEDVLLINQLIKLEINGGLRRLTTKKVVKCKAANAEGGKPPANRYAKRR
jgi:hypothetical protein